MLRTALALFFTATLSACSSLPASIERSFIPDASADFPRFAAAADQTKTSIDHAVWGAFLRKYAAPGPEGVVLVDYAGVSEEGAAALRAYVASLESARPVSLSRDDQLAFWINLYNAATIVLILEHYPVASIRNIKSGPFDFDGPWDQRRLVVSGEALSLHDIEHKIVRPLYDDPRIHYALNCAAKGCPDLRLEPYEGETLDAALDEQARRFINHPRGVFVDDRGRVTASKIFAWYREDYGGGESDVLAHIRRYARPRLHAALDGATSIARYQYDWALNQKE